MSETVTTTAAPATAAPPPSPTPGPEPTAAERWSGRGAPSTAPTSSRAGSIPDAQWEGLPPADQDKYARVKKAGENGGAEWVHRDQLSKEPTAVGQQPASAAAITEDGKLRIGSMELSEADITGLMERHALEQSRKSTMPASAVEYTLDLPSDFAMPEGQTFKFSADHPVLGPILGQAKEFALANGLDQAAFSKMMGLYAASQVHEAQLISKAQAAEREKLGPMIAHRVDAVTNFIRGAVGDDKVAKGMTQRILTADDVVGWEKIIRKATGQGAASFRQDGREPSAGGKGPLSSMSDAEYSALSASEKYSLAKRG